MNIVSLFSGIGGLDLGFISHNIEYFVESDKAAQEVLRARFPGVKIKDDVRNLKRISNSADILLAGFPCQDVSSVGPKTSLNGNRTTLIDGVVDLLRKDRIPYLVLENVPFILHLRGGELLQKLLSSLEDLGYNWAYRIISSHSFLPQRRRRFILVATQNGDAKRILFRKPKKLQVLPPISLDDAIGFYWTEGMFATGLSANSIPALKPGSTIGIPSPPAIRLPNGFFGTPDLRDAERLQGFPHDWTRPAEKVTRNTVRWRLVGNAVAVPIAKWIATGISQPTPVFDEATFRMPTSFPKAAFGSREGRMEVLCDEYVDGKTSGLTTFLKYELKPLSARATSGFLLRATRGGMRFPDGFIDSLTTHLNTVA